MGLGLPRDCFDVPRSRIRPEFGERDGERASVRREKDGEGRKRRDGEERGGERSREPCRRRLTGHTQGTSSGGSGGSGGSGAERGHPIIEGAWGEREGRTGERPGR